MRKVSIRQLQINPTKELEDLPFLVTKYDKPVAVVRKASDLKKDVKKKKDVKSSQKKNGKWVTTKYAGKTWVKGDS